MPLNPITLEDQLAFYRENGYVLIPNAVTPDYLTLLQKETEDCLTDPAYVESGGRNLLDISPVYEILIDGHAGMPVLEALIPDLQLLAMDIRTCPPHGGSMAWHADFGFFSQDPISINTALYLDDLTETNGALRVLPRSHKVPFSLNGDEVEADLPGEVKVICPAGTMVIFSDSLWHRTGKNETDRQRRGIFTYYGHFWMKQTNYPSNPRPLHQMSEYIEGKDPKRMRLMGLFQEGAECNHPDYHADLIAKGLKPDRDWSTTSV